MAYKRILFWAIFCVPHYPLGPTLSEPEIIVTFSGLKKCQGMTGSVADGKQILCVKVNGFFVAWLRMLGELIRIRIQLSRKNPDTDPTHKKQDPEWTWSGSVSYLQEKTPDPTSILAKHPNLQGKKGVWSSFLKEFLKNIQKWRFLS